MCDALLQVAGSWSRFCLLPEYWRFLTCVMQLRGRHRVDGVRRPKFDFHTGSPWDHAYLRKKNYPACGFDKLAQLLDAPKLRAWFVLDHDRHENDAWVLHPKLRHVPMGLTKGFEALGAGLALLRKQHKPRSVDVYASA